MSGIIKLLPDHISNQIAAGEVIQRPASAVKELMENSIDAGSSAIKLIIKDAGKALIQVIDNGSGMGETDARLCFEKHATSKIRDIHDLFAIKTMGFRGEAMASIAAIAQVEMKTRLSDEDLGTQLIIEGSEVLSQTPCQCEIGTQISVKNLFYNVPARRNFLKSNPVEIRHIIDEFLRIALAYPAISFSLYNNDYELYHLKTGNLRQRIVAVFGENYNTKLVPIEEKSDNVQVYGFVGKPDLTKKTRGEQYIFVNKRFIKSQYLNHAIINAYSEMISKDSFPFYALFIDIDPSLIDINVHPTKQEIKFEDDRLVYTFMNAGVRHSLAKYSISPTLDFEQEASINNWDAFTKTNTASNESIIDKIQNRNYTSPPADSARQKNNLNNWEELYKLAASKNAIENINQSTTNLLGTEEENKPHHSSQHFQIHQRYIVSQIKSGFILVDQAAAHERILYEKFLLSLAQNKAISQKQLFPINLEFSTQDVEILKELTIDINSLGFDLQYFGGNTFVLHSLPADFFLVNEKKVIEELLEQYKSNLQITKINKRDALARSLARSSSIKAGKFLNSQEMNSIIDELFSCENPYTTASGQATFISFDFDSLNAEFGKQ
jgi:DNA mismatch repair protein MutL